MTGHGKGKMSDSPGELLRIILRSWLDFTEEELKGKRGSEVSKG